jgi:hypothetical protein
MRANQPIYNQMRKFVKRFLVLYNREDQRNRLLVWSCSRIISIWVTAVGPKAAAGEMEILTILPEKCLVRPASPLRGRSAELLSFWGLFSGRSSVGGLPRQQCKWNHQPWNPVKHDSWQGRWCISSNNEMCQRYNTGMHVGWVLFERAYLNQGGMSRIFTQRQCLHMQ